VDESPYTKGYSELESLQSLYLKTKGHHPFQNRVHQSHFQISSSSWRKYERKSVGHKSVSLESLQNTLQRIADIQSRFESPASAPVPNGNEDAPSFDMALTEAIGNQANAASPVPNALNALIQEQSEAQGVDADLLKAVMKNESNFNPKAVSGVGAQGLMQLMPGTAAGLGVKDSFDPAQNIQGGAKYLKGLLNKYQSVPKAVAAYNAGPGAVDKYQGIPPYKETTQYVKKVMQSYQAYQNASGG
jgi:soluble lytic murein transglycosylase-like protein